VTSVVESKACVCKTDDGEGALAIGPPLLIVDGTSVLSQHIVYRERERERERERAKYLRGLILLMGQGVTVAFYGKLVPN
jgi:hypothetical protein